MAQQFKILIINQVNKIQLKALNFIIYLKDAIQYYRLQIYNQRKQIGTMNFNQYYPIIEQSAQNSRKKLYSTPMLNQQPKLEDYHMQYSTIKKISPFAPGKIGETRRRHKITLKSESAQTFEKQDQLIRLKTSPCKPSPHHQSNRTTLMEISQNQTIHYSNCDLKTQQCQSYLRQPHYTQNNDNILFPKSKKQTAAQSHPDKNSVISGHQSINQLSKSKRKMEFTLYQQKKMSKSKKSQRSLSIKASIKKQKHYELPYPYQKNVCINLFNVQDGKDQTRLRSISRTRNSKSKSLERSRNITRILSKTKTEVYNELKVSKFFEKLEKYKFVLQHLQQNEIISYLNGYKLKGEPQCKWIILIIDEAFKRMRSQGKTPTHA